MKLALLVVAESKFIVADYAVNKIENATNSFKFQQVKSFIEEVFMRFLNDIAFILFGLSDQHELSQKHTNEELIANPATGLPVVSKTNIDVAGNPIGVDMPDTDYASVIEPDQINSASCLSYVGEKQSRFDDDFSSDISGVSLDDLSF